MLTLSLFVVLMTSVAVTSQSTVVQELQGKLDQLEDDLAKLSQYAMMQQFAAEERVRSEGYSGVNVIRGTEMGIFNYHSNSHVGNGMMAIHDHPNYFRTIGQGEIVAVLNGVSFRTRHNDYSLVMASPNSTEKHAVEDIPFPEVPPEVTNKLLVKDQMAEMKEWFKAFAEQNHTVRDYRKYFKPLLCYLEGTWNINDKFDEPFKSERHALEAGSWEELTGKVRFSSYTGTKSRLENFAYLPTTLMSINETTGEPQYAQWNYRMLCSPLQEDVPLSDLRPVDDLSYRIAAKRPRDYVLNGRRGRFTFFEKDEEKFPGYTKLDRLFHTIPGMDNGPANLNQASSDDKILNMSPGSDQPLNTGYYHRMYKTESGSRKTFRGFNDPNLWVAETSQEDVAPMSIKSCKESWVTTGTGNNQSTTTCETKQARFTYAIPLEILFLTPLLTWNPYNLTIHGRGDRTVTDGNRDGKLTKEKAYNGVSGNKFFMTPVEFFTGALDLSDPADTVRGSVGVLDPNGDLRVTTASGTRIKLQTINGIGSIRLRYPIAPIHGEGSTVYKELNALRTKLEQEDPSYI